MLISPLNAFPWVLNGLMEAWVSVKRLQAFLSLDNLDLTGYYQQLDCSDKGEGKCIVYSFLGTGCQLEVSSLCIKTELQSGCSLNFYILVSRKSTMFFFLHMKYWQGCTEYFFLCIGPLIFFCSFSLLLNDL